MVEGTPLLDQGFLRSDLTYDVPAVWDGRFFYLNNYLARLEASCKKSRLRLPRAQEEIKSSRNAKCQPSCSGL